MASPGGQSERVGRRLWLTTGLRWGLVIESWVGSTADGGERAHS
jgi:hypothetical protein